MLIERRAVNGLHPRLPRRLSLTVVYALGMGSLAACDTQAPSPAVETYFSPDYVTARDGFRQAAQRAGGRLTARELAANGPGGEDLTIDIAWFGPDTPRRAFIHSSGVHGVEAFAGSAIQLQWLEEGILLRPRVFLDT